MPRRTQARYSVMVVTDYCRSEWMEHTVQVECRHRAGEAPSPEADAPPCPDSERVPAGQPIREFGFEPIMESHHAL